MLRKRVEVLFGEREYSRLEELARSQKRSVGSVVREAVETYVTQPADEKRQAAWKRLLSRDIGRVGSPEEIKKIITDSQLQGILKSLETD
jgi:predicted transcriptional regulator